MLHNNHKIALLLLIFLLLPLLSGCWDSKEIDKRANILAIGIDEAKTKEQKHEDEIAHFKNKLPISNEKMIKLTAQIAVPGRIPLGPEQGGGGPTNPVLVIPVVGHTIDDALVNLQQEVSNPLFLGHLRIIVLNEKVARKGTQQINDFLRRNPQIRRTANLVVSKEHASSYMKVNPKLERIPSLYLADMIDNLSGLGKFPPSFIGLFWTHLSSKGQDAYLPYLSIKGKDNIQLNGLALFKGERMAGKTSPLEIGDFMSVIGIYKGGYGAFSMVPGTDTVVMIGTKTRRSRIKVYLKKGKPHVLIRVRYECEIDEKQSQKVYIANSGMVKKIEKEFSGSVEESIKSFIKKTQSKESDIFGFGEYFRAKLPKYWKGRVRTKENWEKIFKNDLTFNVKVDTHLNRVGMKAK
ncbi:MAG: Ger(x)C family spore germination protein [Bacillota bacterium]|nr:Ger(x)C family spore germination protein [Bacillota bacterium]